MLWRCQISMFHKQRSFCTVPCYNCRWSGCAVEIDLIWDRLKKFFFLCLSVQSCIDWNRDVLKRELGLDDADIIDLPILFKLEQDTDYEFRAVAFYPDMVQRKKNCSDIYLEKNPPEDSFFHWLYFFSISRGKMRWTKTCGFYSNSTNAILIRISCHSIKHILIKNIIGLTSPLK